MKFPVFLSVLFFMHFTLLKAYACNIPLHITNHIIPKIPEPVINTYCNPKESFESFLLIRAAIRVKNPVYRIITIKRKNNVITYVKLLQFLSDGTPHPPQNNQDQDEIIFKKNHSDFVAKVKGNKTTISFTSDTFQFTIHRIIGGMTIRQALNSDGEITLSGGTTQLLLIQTIRKEKWRWVLNDGTLVDFKAH